jgi:cytochrome c553
MRTSTLAALAVLAAPAAPAAEPVDADFFEKRVRPLLAEHCTRCHDASKQRGGLRLDTKAAFAKGGDTGPAVVPGDPDKSLLTKVVRYGGDIKMPPKGKLADADLALLETWVKGGAPWPDGAGPNPKEAGDEFDLRARAAAHWSFQPIKRPPVPKAGHPVDAFLRAKLDAAGLAFAPPADKRVLLRRATFDLTGLPPTSDEVAAFLKDESPDAYEKVVDRLLASPHYGERWGRHWLDLARYAETHGHEFDFDIPDAWRYRDYVVRAFNADLPFDRFLTEHLAGDLLPDPRFGPDGTNESLVATGFWWLGEAKHSPVDSRAEQADRVDNQIDVFGKAVLGLTISCARCHDHKFDPIATKDYYALFGVLASTRYHRADAADPAPTARLLDELKRLRPPASGGRRPRDAKTDQGADAPRSAGQLWRDKATAFETFGPGWRARWDAAGLGLRPEADDGFPHTGREVRKLAGALRSPTFTIDKPYLAVRAAGRDAKARVVLNGLQLIQNPIYGGLAHPVNHGDELRWVTFDLRMWRGQPAYLELLDEGPGYVAATEAWFADAPPPAEPGTRVSLPEAGDDKVRELEAKVPDPRLAPTARDGTGISERVFVRGNHKSLGAEAPRGFLEAFGKPPFAGPGSGRLELAKAVTDPANPLVARVLVNRLWKHHFGEGLVRSPDDFGKQGRTPTHPELLDWLAAELVDQKWSLKRMHRLMLLSAAYKQSSRATAEQAAKAVTADPLNELLHRQNPRRLEAEAVRDAILAVSGRLDRTAGGPGVMPHLTEHSVGRGKPADSGPLDGGGRRSVYLAVRRNFLSPMFTAFDYPTPFTTIGRRTVSNVPAQALVMLNNPFVLQQAELWAKRALAEPNRTAAQRVAGMYEAALGRPPTAAESEAAVGFLKGQADEYGAADHPKAWADLAHVLFNAKEFILVE